MSYEDIEAMLLGLKHIHKNPRRKPVETYPVTEQ